MLPLILLLCCYTELVVTQGTVGSPSNCLQESPEALDAALELFWGPNKYYNISQEDIMGHLLLVRSRFNQGHMLDYNLSIDVITRIGIGANKELANSSGKTISLFVMTENPKYSSSAGSTSAIRSENKLIKSYLNTLIALEKINSGERKPIAGLYLNSKSVKTYRSKLDAVLEIFGPKNSSSIKIGEFFSIRQSCINTFNKKTKVIRDYLKRLDFISCEIKFEDVDDPDANTDSEAALSECIKTKQVAVKKRISAEIRCVIEYDSESSLAYPKNSSEYYDNFRTFWCNIIEETKKATYPRIILLSAFPANENNPSNKTSYCSSWWKRINETSQSPRALIEKVQASSVPTDPSKVCSENCEQCSPNNCSLVSTEIVPGTSDRLEEDLTIEEGDRGCFIHKEPLCKINVSDVEPLFVTNQTSISQKPTEDTSSFENITRDDSGVLKSGADRCQTLPIGFWVGWAFALQRTGSVGFSRNV